MSIDLELIRAHTPLETLVGEHFNLRKSGSRYIGVEHGSLVVTPQTGFYFWNSRGEYGDVFDFAGRHLLGYADSWNNRDVTMFKAAVQCLAQRAGIPYEMAGDTQDSPRWAERELVTRLHETLLNTPTALQYATEIRGWTLETIRSAHLGFMPADKSRLLEGLYLPERWCAIIERFPAGMLVYVHRQHGQLTYLSGRSIEGKRHYNPPRELLGERQHYFNRCYHPTAPQVVLVEGQADAVTFEQWQIPAVALCGLTISESLMAQLKQHERVFILLDNVAETEAQSERIARALGSKAYLPQLPDEVKDANSWLLTGATQADAEQLLNRARKGILAAVKRASALEGIAREDAIRDLCGQAQGLDAFALAEFKQAMQEIGVRAGVLNALIKVGARSQPDTPEILIDDTLPVLNPVQDFCDDLALVTIALRERTKDNRINVHPYLVTSTRELIRVSDQQILTLGGREIALRDLPYGGEFLMRWRYNDIQRFLMGETVNPGELYTTLRIILTTYIDFQSDSDSHVLTLWIIGTYFYALFPAYPYLALNGPKGSGKSTVLRVLQSLAFNMVTTSDPTGASLFRLVHATRCTLGIDEAERYQNPRDPATQQIRQLLNSGYKAGMPALRVVGDDFRPQAFDVYSPKILASIAGLENVLSSRCITIPMRPTARRLPVFPASFDGARLRHELYSLALTYFGNIRRSCTRQLRQPTSSNRLSELWSPLFALASFFEVVGGINSLSEISATADVSA